MLALSVVREVKSFGFKNVDYTGWSTRLEHPCGLVVYIDDIDNEWAIEHHGDTWTEVGKLSDTMELFKIIREYVGK